MTQKSSPTWIRKWFRPLVASLVTTGAVATTYGAAGVFGNSEGNFPNLSPQVASQDAHTAATEEALNITVYRSPSCGCCGRWIENLKTQGFQTKDVKTSNMEAVKQKYGVPEQLQSCHTAAIDGYVIEGHIPAADIKSLLAEKPDVAGIAVPGMPIGSPGMEAGGQKQPFTVFSFNEEGKAEVFGKYPS